MSHSGENTYNGLPEASQEIATSFLGPPYVGYILQFILFGIFASNFFAYIVTANYRDDRRSNQVYIWVVFVLCTIATGINAFEAFFHGVSQDRTADSLYMITVPDALTPMMTGTIGFVVQSFLTVRASRLFGRQRVWRAVFLGCLSVIMLVAWLGSIGAGIASLGFTYGFVDKLEATGLNYNKMIGTWMWLSAAVDCTITATLFLSMKNLRLGFNANTDNAVRRIMATAALTALYTAFFAVMGALMSVVFSQSNTQTVDILFAFDIPLAALYSLSLLTTLDSRGPITNAKSVVYPSINVGLPSAAHTHTLAATPGPEWHAKHTPAPAYPPSSPSASTAAPGTPRDALCTPGTPRALVHGAHRRTASLAKGGLDVLNKTLEMIKNGAGTGDITPPRAPRNPGITVTREIAREVDVVVEEPQAARGLGARRGRTIRIGAGEEPGTPDSW